MITVPKSTILQSKGLGDTIGDIVDSFNLDLSSNYGAVRANRMKKITISNGTLDKPVAFTVYNGKYYFICTNYIYEGDEQPSDAFAVSNAFTAGKITEGTSDMKLFNDHIYVSGTDDVWSSNDGSTFGEVISSGLTQATPHLLEYMNAGSVARLYITDNYTKVRSIATNDVLTTDGQAYSLNLNLPPQDWSISTIKKCSGLIWLGLVNINDGTGLMVSWDGASADTRNATYNLPSGVISSTVLDSVLYIIDAQGIIKRFAGNSFQEVARLPKKNPSFFRGSLIQNNTRFIHPNGMQTTDRGTILIHLANDIGNITYDNNVPSGIWEYDPNIGLYHKYSVSVSATTGTSYDDFGQQRVSSAGALYSAKPASPSLTDGGNILCGATYFTNASSTASGVFCDDSLNTTTKWGYLITSKIFGNIQEQWNKVYTLYKKLSASNSKIVVKYRTEEDTPTETTITWVDIDRFTSSVSLTSYAVGDEVQVIQGTGSGQSSHIKSIDGSTYILEDNFPTAVIGLTSKALVSKWIKAGDITYGNEQQFKGLTLTLKNSSPFIQFKVCMQFNGNDELNKLQIISKPQTIE